MIRPTITRKNDDGVLRELVLCSLEPWDEIWRRNQFLVRELTELEPALRVLFVEPAVDVALEVVNRRRWATGHRVRPLRSDAWAAYGVARDAPTRVSLVQPTKWLPRVAGPLADELIFAGVRRGARAMGFDKPILWINDLALAPLLAATGWPCLYDVTDDWLLSDAPPRVLERRAANERSLLDHAEAVIVCSPALVTSKGCARPVHLVPNAVDSPHLRSPQSRPSDLPSGAVVCYVGTLHEDRLDVELCVDLARGLGGQATFVLVGPDALRESSRRRLSEEPGIHVLGARPYGELPGYLQYADVLVVPHVRTPFTESLDPIKAYEYRAVGRPVVATAVAGFRGLGPPVVTVEGDAFVGAVLEALSLGPPSGDLGPLPDDVPTWRERAEVIREVLRDIAAHATRPG